MTSEIMPPNPAYVPGAARTAPRQKIRTLDEIAVIAGNLRRQGRRVVQCHGTFDLLHLGHVRHLEAARQLGDVLVVTVTADRYVNKGPGRPVFGQDLRAEMLASVEHVDWVAVDDAPDAVNAINQIQPDIYVKGQDYQNSEGDITGRIIVEREAVEAHGGATWFTDEVTFSSTELINQHLNLFEPQVREHLDAFRYSGGLEELIGVIESVKDYRVLFVGDAIIDEYQYVLPMGKSPKENVIATRYQDREVFAGGVFAAANHVASFCEKVDIITCLGAADNYDDLIRTSLRPNVGVYAFRRPGAPTTLKRRFVDPSYMHKLFETYVMNDEPLDDDLQRQVDDAISSSMPQYDLVIVTDFGHGLLSETSIGILTGRSCPFLAVNAQSNTGNLGYNLIIKYPRADYICIDAPEARLALGDRLSPISDIASRLLNKYIDCSRMVITQGKHGCMTYERGGVAHTIPAFTRRVIDTVGAGDAFFAVTAPLVAAGAPIRHIGFIGNVVGALKVEIVGHRRSIDKPSLLKSLHGLLR